MADLTDIFDEFDTEFEEGANTDARKAFKEAKSTYKDNIRSARKAYKSGDYDSAKNHISVAKNALTDAENVISTIDSNVLEVCIGDMISLLKEGLKEIILAVPTFGIGGLISGIKYTIDHSVEQMDGAVKRGNARKGDFNEYVNDFKIAIKKMRTATENLEKKITQSEKSGDSKDESESEKKKEETKEKSETFSEDAEIIQEKEISLLSSFYEDADSTAVDQFFIESAFTDGAKNLVDKAIKTIQQLIDNFKEFTKNFRAKIQDQRVKAELNKVRNSAKKKIQIKIRDKDVRAYYKDIADLSAKFTKRSKEIHDQFTRGKISYDEFKKRLDKLTEDLEKAALTSNKKHRIEERLVLNDINTSLEVGKACDILDSLVDEQEKVATIIDKTILEQEDGFLKSVKDLRSKVFHEDGEDSSKKKGVENEKIQQLINAKTYIAKKMSGAGRILMVGLKYVAISKCVSFVIQASYNQGLNHGIKQGMKAGREEAYIET